MINTIVRNNHTLTHDGGGLDAGGTVTISNSQIYSNTSGNIGGGLNIGSGGKVTINNSQIYSNNANGNYGGGISSHGVLTVTQSTLNGNSVMGSSFIGALPGGGGIFNFSGVTATLTNVTISGNSAINAVGGGIENYGGTAMLTNVTLSGNSANSGGGIYNDSGSTATLTNVTLSGNSAADGGGIFNNFSTAGLTNTTLSGNSTTHYGGGIYNNYGTATLTNVTLSGNSANSGGGIFHFTSIAGKTITLKNNIAANSPLGGNCYTYPGSVTNITSTGFNLSDDTSCTTYFTQVGDQNNKSAQLGPLANNGGFTLTHMPLPPSVSGAGPIDNGTCAVSSDQRGVSRPQGVACDIGAVERKPGDFGVYLNLPLIVR